MTKLGILKFKKYKEARKGRPTTGKYYAKAVQDRTVDFEDFVTHMSEHNSPYSRGVIHGVLIDMLSCLQELVLDGKSVRLGELGLFSIGMTTRPADTAELFTVRTSRAYTSTCATRRHGATPSCARNAVCRSSRNHSYGIDGGRR